MQMALVEARAAANEGETPIGAVLACGEQVIATAHNQKELLNDVSAHAEIKVLRDAGKQRGDWRLSDCTLYVTLEPCPMCTGAILAARVGRVVYGAKNPVAGAMGSVIDLPRYPLGSKPVVISGVMEDACRELLQDFFRNCR
ncbi:MAG: nucleoside deaminase [Clostridia bacterium]|nr:nucleoside deaminase [Clostridia bacterium]MBQ8716655.1 nucleoside deaminase [Clostridia bacterium]